MNVAGYVGLVLLVLGVAYATRWFDPSALAKLARRTGLNRRRGWALAVVATAWVFLPVLAGAEVGGGRGWVLGAAIGGAGWFLATIAASSLDEYRLLRRASLVPPDEVVADPDTLVATSGRPTPTSGPENDPVETPFSGKPALHTDWLVQRRERVGLRTIWRNHAQGVRSVPFTLDDGSVLVAPGRHRVFSDTGRQFDVGPDDPLEEPVASFLDVHPDLPSPEVRERPLRVIETYVPADEPVTVVGFAEQAASPGQLRIDDAPVDDLLGTHTDYGTSPGASEAVLIAGSASEAQATMRKRVRWLGAAGALMAVSGQALAFWLSSASLAALL